MSDHPEGKERNSTAAPSYKSSDPTAEGVAETLSGGGSQASGVHTSGDGHTCEGFGEKQGA